MAKVLSFVDDTNVFENALNSWAETIVPGPGQIVVGGADGALTKSIIEDVLAIYGLPSYATGSVYFVDATAGSDSNAGRGAGTAWKSLSKVISTAQAGDTVLFKRGQTWTGSLALTTNGRNGAPIIFGTYGRGAKPTIDGGGTVDCVAASARSWLEFHDLRATNGQEFGFLFGSGAHHINVYNCDSDHAGNDNLIFIDGAHDCLVAGGVFSSSGGIGGTQECTGVEVADDCHDITISGVECFANGDEGIGIHAHDGEIFPWNITIQGAKVHDNTGSGIQPALIDGARMWSAPKLTIDGCQFTNNGRLGINITKAGTATAYPDAITMTNNVITGNSPTGADYQVVLRGQNAVFTRNLAVAVTERGVLCDGCVSLTFQHNTVYVPAGTGFFGVFETSGAGTNGINARNNIFATGSTGVFVLKIASGAATGLVLDYNLSYTPSGAAANRWSWLGTSTTFANYKTTSSQDSHSPAPADPLFTNVAGGDYTLQATSPALNVGVDLGLPYRGTAPDLGYVERMT